MYNLLVSILTNTCMSYSPFNNKLQHNVNLIAGYYSFSLSLYMHAFAVLQLNCGVEEKHRRAFWAEN